MSEGSSPPKPQYLKLQMPALLGLDEELLKSAHNIIPIIPVAK
jgi:hypothetical protein